MKDLIELGKPRIVFMVLVTAALGYLLGNTGSMDLARLVTSMLLMGLAVAGSGVLNNFLEREHDARMQRTSNRPLPAGRVNPATALFAGTASVLLGVGLLAWTINLLTAFLILLGAFLYVLVYTPMKRITWLNTMVGAIPGAIPPMAGWTAASGQLEPGAWALFAILYLWQHPHFYAIAWMYKEDYRVAGFKMLPAEDPTGRKLFRQVNLFCTLLIMASLLPVATGSLGWVYILGTLGIGIFMYRRALVFTRSGEVSHARGLLRASVVYLPLWLLLTITDFAVRAVL